MKYIVRLDDGRELTSKPFTFIWNTLEDATWSLGNAMQRGYKGQLFELVEIPFEQDLFDALKKSKILGANH